MKKEAIVYKLLKLDFHSSFLTGRGVPNEYVHIGTVLPSDIAGVVVAVADAYVAMLDKMLNCDALYPENRNVLAQKQWIHFKDYLKLHKAFAGFSAKRERASLMIKEETRLEKDALIQAKDPFQGVKLSRSRMASLKEHFMQISTASEESYFGAVKESGLAFAEFFDAPLPLYIPQRSLRMHALINGQSGSAKSELVKLLIHHYVAGKRSAVAVLDPKNDLSEQVSRFRILQGDRRLIYIDPDLDGGRRVPVLNPFDLKDRSERNVRIVSEELSSAFETLVEGATFTVNMRAMLLPCVTVLLEREGSSLHDLMRFMDDHENDDLIAAGTASRNPGVREFFAGKFADKMFAPTKHGIYTKVLSLMNSPLFAKVIGGGASTVDLEAAVEDGMVIVVNLAKGSLGRESSRAFGAFLLAMFQGIALKRAKTAKDRRLPLQLFVDEFQNLISPSIEEILTESRAYGLHLTLASQVAGQGMDSALKQILLTNTDVKIRGKNHEKPYSDLRVGQYYAKVGNSPEFKFSNLTHLLDTRGCVASDEWEVEKGRQLSRWYREVNLKNHSRETPLDDRSSGNGKRKQSDSPNSSSRVESEPIPAPPEI